MIYRFFEKDELSFNPDRVYKKGEECIFKGKLFRCIGENSVNENPFFSKNWNNLK